MPESDPRLCRTLGEAALNPDGVTYDGARALSWLSRHISGHGHGLTVEEVRAIWAEEAAKHGAAK